MTGALTTHSISDRSTKVTECACTTLRLRESSTGHWAGAQHWRSYCSNWRRGGLKGVLCGGYLATRNYGLATDVIGCEVPRSCKVAPPEHWRTACCVRRGALKPKAACLVVARGVAAGLCVRRATIDSRPRLRRCRAFEGGDLEAPEDLNALRCRYLRNQQLIATTIRRTNFSSVLVCRLIIGGVCTGHLCSGEDA